MPNSRTSLLPNQCWSASIKENQVQVKTMGEPFSLPRSCYVKTNHFIKQSRNYFTGYDLPVYLYIPQLEYVRCLFWLLSFVGFYGGYLTFACFLSCVIWLAVHTQHEYVSRTVLPIILQQAVFPWQNESNSFYRIDFQRVQATPTVNSALPEHEGQGFINVRGSTCQFQAFNLTAVDEMKKARKYSRAFLIMFVLTLIYNGYFLLTDLKTSLTLLNIGLLFLIS